MPNIAIVQDGAEVVRQRFADTAETLERIEAILDRDGYLNFVFKVFPDDKAAHLLDGIRRAEWDCVVFVSNATRSGDVEAALKLHRDHLKRYISDGGGIVILHQIGDGALATILPDEICPDSFGRNWEDFPSRTEAEDPDDVLLNFPETVTWSDLRDLEPGELASFRAQTRSGELGLHYYKLIKRDTLPAKLMPVLRSSHGDILVTRSLDHVPENIVVTTLPLDWQSRRPGQDEATLALLANSIRFAALGSPRRMVWQERNRDRVEVQDHWLSLDGATAFLPAPVAPDVPASRTANWLMGIVDVVLLSNEGFERAHERQEFASFLSGGGTIASIDFDRALSASRISALVGAFEERALASTLLAELRASPEWRTVDSAFSLRNIIAALAAIEAKGKVDSGPLDEASVRDLVGQISERLSIQYHRDDFSSSLALVQAYAFMAAPERVPPESCEWLAADCLGRDFDIVIQAEATLAVARRSAATSLLAKSAADLDANLAAMRSAAPLIRILDAIAIVRQAGLLPVKDEAAATLADVVCMLLVKFPADPGGGWISVEATSDLVRGLVALDSVLPVNDVERKRALASHIATGATALRRWRQVSDRSQAEVSRLARLTHALIDVERYFPVGLQRMASLDWPNVPGEALASRNTRLLLDQLAKENETLRQDQAELKDAMADLGGLRDQERRSARLGRFVATIFPTILLGVAVWRLIILFGLGSPAGILTNLAILIPLSATALVGGYRILARLHLLAGPAIRFGRWAQEASIVKLPFRS